MNEKILIIKIMKNNSKSNNDSNNNNNNNNWKLENECKKLIN